MSKKTLSRRAFLGGATVASAALFAESCRMFEIVPRSVLGGKAKFVPPSEKVNIACIGCGGKGSSDIDGVSSENLVAFCDVDQKRAADTFKKYPDVKRYEDFRVMLDQEDKNIDAVTISTPDHTHAAAAMMAMEMGKHVFVQKPLTHNIYEARKLTETAEKWGCATMMGIQGHFGDGMRKAREWYEAGAIGEIQEIQIWTNRPIWPQGMDVTRPEDKPEVPETMAWDLWLGPAPYRSYHPDYAPFKWRGWWDFGTGALGDIGCHAMDAPFWIFDLGMPTSVEAETAPYNDETYPAWSEIVYEFPAKGDRGPVKLRWYDGGKKPPKPPELEEDGRDMPVNAQLFVGDQGKIMTTDIYCHSPRIIPEAKMKDFMENEPEEKYERSIGEYKEWIRGIKGGPKPGANFGYSGPLSEMVLLGNLAILSEQNKVFWDSKAMKVTNDPNVNKYIRRDYRKGYHL